ncbi:hypothetical protein BO71DRAFT_433307 [Aspergillus ellipticus CBS 707.79]|uniref:Uncharacterized protein n=1 Tax=Aspergillus ellipticus CBS 707.79 TaxID=1448320 RepID=A0A319D0F4_9EURO|nr:hypothetical protein BO71DRAFT_433307 [Aspergillus ellipticus CBS 707.79]
MFSKIQAIAIRIVGKVAKRSVPDPIITENGPRKQPKVVIDSRKSGIMRYDEFRRSSDTVPDSETSNTDEEPETVHDSLPRTDITKNKSGYVKRSIDLPPDASNEDSNPQEPPEIIISSKDKVPAEDISENSSCHNRQATGENDSETPDQNPISQALGFGVLESVVRKYRSMKEKASVHDEEASELREKINSLTSSDARKSSELVALSKKIEEHLGTIDKLQQNHSEELDQCKSENQMLEEKVAALQEELSGNRGQELICATCTKIHQMLDFTKPAPLSKFTASQA